jgi:hypothetical protein
VPRHAEATGRLGFAAPLAVRRDAAAAKVFNQQLRVTAGAVGGRPGDDHEYGFTCECGCRETAMATLAEYDRGGGAWLEGHHHPT